MSMQSVYRVCDKCPDLWGAVVESSPSCEAVHPRKQTTRKVATLQGLGGVWSGPSLGYSASCYSQRTQRFILIGEG